MRCYNGAWDSAATVLFAEQDRLLTKIREYEPNAHCTYFPDGGTFQVHVYGRPLGHMSFSKTEALKDALNKLNIPR